MNYFVSTLISCFLYLLIAGTGAGFLSSNQEDATRKLATKHPIAKTFASHSNTESLSSSPATGPLPDIALKSIESNLNVDSFQEESPQPAQPFFPAPTPRQFPDYSAPSRDLHDIMVNDAAFVDPYPTDDDYEELMDRRLQERRMKYANSSLDCPSKSKKQPTIPYGTKPEFKLTKKFKKLPLLVAGWLGHQILLECPHRKGCPRAEVAWFKDGSEVEASKSSYSGRSQIKISRKKDKLTIMDNRMEDDGVYTCNISNVFGSISHAIRVESVPRVVARPPELLPDQPGNQTVEVGGAVRLRCQVLVRDSTNPHSITWYKHFLVNGLWEDPVTEKVYARKLQETDTHIGDDETLVLSNVTEEDEGFYTCSVSNQFGNLVRSGFVNVTEPLPETEEEPQLSSFYIYLLVGVAGGTGLGLFIVVCVMCIKYRREKKFKLLAVENAQCVAKWTKKVIIERNFVAELGNENDEILTPLVRVEKVLSTGGGGGHEDDHTMGEIFEFQVDELWEFNRDMLDLGAELGQGAFGKVVKGLVHGAVIKSELSLSPGCHLVATTIPGPPITVAVKMVKDDASEQEVLDLVKEIEIMKAVGGHVNIVNLLGACTQPAGRPLLAILEFAEHGNLRDYLRRRRGFCSRQSGDQLDTVTETRPVALKEMLSFAWQVARGMEFLANRRCVHRDLAARNILIAKGGVAKVADFGLARDVDQSDYYRKVTEGKLPVLWMSPESLFDGVSSTKSDVWSFGVLLWEIVTCGERPYTGVATEALLDLIRDGYRMTIPLQCPHNLYQIMRNCWQLKPGSRPSWAQLVDTLLALYHDTLPGVYLDLALPSIPTPPSSAENSDCSDNIAAAAAVYNTITSVVSGIAPLARTQLLNPGYRSKYSTGSEEPGEDSLVEEAEVEHSRDSFESGYGSQAKTRASNTDLGPTAPDWSPDLATY